MGKSFHFVMVANIIFLILLSFSAIIEGELLGSAVNGIGGYIVALCYLLSFDQGKPS